MFTPRRELSQSFKASPRFERSSRRQAAGVVGARVVSDGAGHVIEGYGCPLPVRVSEAISSSRGSECTARMSETGWAWLVTGQKAAVWHYEPSPSGKPGVCRVLPLPYSALGNTSELMCVLCDESGTKVIMATCEGTIRYWSNVLQEHNFIELNANLTNQLMVKMCYIQRNAMVVIATNDGVVFTVNFDKSDLTCAPLIESSGMMSAVSRRVSSFIFGGAAQPSDTSNTMSLHGVTCTNNSERDEFIYLLGDQQLKKIHYNTRSQIYSVDIKELISGELAKMRIEATDITLMELLCTKSGVVILVTYKQSEGILQFGFAHVCTNSLIAPTQVDSFVPTNLTVDAPDQNQMLSVYLIYPDPVYQTAYVGVDQAVYAVSTMNPDSRIDKMEFTGTSECILGMGFHASGQGAVVLAFTRQRGVMSIRSALSADVKVGAFLNDSTLNESIAGAAVADRTLDHSVVSPDVDIASLTQTDTPTNLLKAAFLVWLTDGQPQGSHVLDQFDIPLDHLDTHVLDLSERILDDFPVNDPRWAENKLTQDIAPLALSVLIMNQLEEKLKIHRLFVTFLASTGLSDKLKTSRGQSTRQILYEKTELVVAAIAIRNVQSESPEIVEAAIKKCITLRGVPSSSRLTPSDLFYREVSKVSDFLPELLQLEEAKLPILTSFNDIVALVCNANILCITVILEVTKYREAAYLSNIFQKEVRYIPWTKSDIIRTLLIKQCELTYQYALPNCETPQDSSTVSQQLADITDIICDGFVTVVGGNQEKEEEYKETRKQLLQPFLDIGQYERAAELAEKYLDFGTLIQLCERTDDDDRLSRYQQRYTDYGFNELLFDHYIKEGKRSKLLSQPAAALTDVDTYLQEEDNSDLRWLHGITQHDYVDAHKTLAQMALRETDSVERKKTLFSLSKLAALASDDMEELTPAIEAIDRQHILIHHQEALPEEVIKGLGMNSKDMHVLKVTDMIEAYIGDFNPSATELDFKKALDLLSFCDEETTLNVAALKMHIWCRSILRDDWSQKAQKSDEPITQCRDKAFFRLIEIIGADMKGKEILSVMPTIDQLLMEKELSEILKTSTCEFLLRAGYEHLQQAVEFV